MYYIMSIYIEITNPTPRTNFRAFFSSFDVFTSKNTFLNSKTSILHKNTFIMLPILSMYLIFICSTFSCLSNRGVWIFFQVYKLWFYLVWFHSTHRNPFIHIFSKAFAKWLFFLVLIRSETSANILLEKLYSFFKCQWSIFCVGWKKCWIVSLPLLNCYIVYFMYLYNVKLSGSR